MSIHRDREIGGWEEEEEEIKSKEKPRMK